jgi:hypothetical protein
VSYLVLAAIYTVIVSRPPRTSGAARRRREPPAVATGVCGGGRARGREFFFRGFLPALQQLGTVLGVLGSAAITYPLRVR